MTSSTRYDIAGSGEDTAGPAAAEAPAAPEPPTGSTSDSPTGPQPAGGPDIQPAIMPEGERS